MSLVEPSEIVAPLPAAVRFFLSSEGQEKGIFARIGLDDAVGTHDFWNHNSVSIIEEFSAELTGICAAMMVSRSLDAYRSKCPAQTALINRIKEIATARVRYGYQRIHVLLRREGWMINHKRVYRLYKQAGLSLYQRRPKRHRSAMQRQPLRVAQRINECWAMDFVSDQLYDGRKLRALTVLDAYTRESLTIWVDQAIRGDDVVAALDRIRIERVLPQRISVDNGPEFISKAVGRWAYEHQVELHFSRPGKPTDNAYIEALNG